MEDLIIFRTPISVLLELEEEAGMLSRQICQSSDDCIRRASDSDAIWLNNVGDYCGDYDGTYYDHRCGMRFQNVEVPQGSTIISALLWLKAKQLIGSIFQSYIYGQNSDNAATFSTAADYDARPRTSQYVTWTPPSWNADTWYSVDVKNIIQAIINRSGWVSGNAIALFWQEDSGYQAQRFLIAYSYDEDPASAPKLEILW